MQGSAKRNAIIACSILLFVLVIWGVWQLKPRDPSDSSETSLASSLGFSTEESAANVPDLGSTSTAKPTALMDAGTNCPLQADQKGQLVLTVDIRSCFDYFWSNSGEKSQSQLIVDIRRYLTTILPSVALPYAFKLLDQYMAYRNAQTALPNQNDTQNLDAVQAFISDQKKLQLKFFTATEADVLFGNERAYDQYNIDLMKINADNRLTEAQKATKIAQLLDQLPASLADSMQPLMQYAELQDLTMQIRARGGSDQDVRTMRENLIGSPAVGRPGRSGEDEATWQQRVGVYLEARTQILKTGRDLASKQQAIVTLRNRTFSTPEERLRAQTYEAMIDQGDAGSF
jgi:lipase chaperone LimK